MKKFISVNEKLPIPHSYYITYYPVIVECALSKTRSYDVKMFDISSQEFKKGNTPGRVIAWLDVELLELRHEK